MTIKKVKRRRGFKSHFRHSPPPKPAEKLEAKEESEPVEESSTSRMTDEQKAIFYPADIPNPPSEPE